MVTYFLLFQRGEQLGGIGGDDERRTVRHKGGGRGAVSDRTGRIRLRAEHTPGELHREQEGHVLSR